MGLGGQRHDQGALPPEKTRYTVYRRLGGPQGPVWTGAENRVAHGIRSLDITARRVLLYRLHYSGPLLLPTRIQFFISVLTYTFFLNDAQINENTFNVY
jgi:hypothetical protein